MKKLKMSVGWWMPHYEKVKDVSRMVKCHIMKKLRMSVGWWMSHYEEAKDVSRLVDATL
jgi:hypothetical protein